MISEILIVSIGLGVFALLVTAALAPLETLSWWAGWTEQELDETAPTKAPNPVPDGSIYIVYLSGVASISGKYLLRREEMFLRALGARLPNAVIIDDVFPYSPAGLPLLASPRLFDRLWRWIQKLDLQGHRTLLRILINFRNIYQVMVSADHRYGPIFSQGAAGVVESALKNAGYKPAKGAPIILIGYSGGAQVAAGAAPFLKARLGAPIQIMSIGGVVASDPGLVAVDGFHHFHGDRDRIEKLGAVMFAERWSLYANSHWNTAKREGRIKIHDIENMGHAGPKGYFGLPKRNGQSNNERMADTVAAELLRATRE